MGGVVEQDSVLATVTEYLIVVTGKEFKWWFVLMGPPLCFLLFLGVERVWMSLMDRLDRRT